MGDQNAQADPAAEAQAVLFQEVYLPAFAEKCAELGIQFADEDSLVAALETVSMLKQSNQAQSNDIVKAAHAALCERSGVATPEQRKAAKTNSEKAASIAKSDVVKGALAALAQSQAQS
jgi:hypothetical protein